MNKNYQLIYSSSNHIEAEIIRTKLQNEGFEVFSRGEILNTITGEVSIEGGMIELFVHKDNVDVVQKLLKMSVENKEAGQIVCSICNELNYNNFSHCWNCNNNLSDPQGDNRLVVEEDKPQPQNYYLLTTIAVIILLIAFYNLK